MFQYGTYSCHYPKKVKDVNVEKGLLLIISELYLVLPKVICLPCYFMGVKLGSHFSIQTSQLCLIINRIYRIAQRNTILFSNYN